MGLHTDPDWALMGRTHGESKIRAENRTLVQPAIAIALIAFFTGLAVIASSPTETSAHPLGNFTINHFTSLDFSGRTVRLHYAVDIAEIPTYDEIKMMDTNGDRIIDKSEKDAYLPKRVAQLRAGLHLTNAGQDLPLSTASSSMNLTMGQAGLRILRIDAEFNATLPSSNDPLSLHFEDDNFSGHIGWREIVATAGNGARIVSTNALASSVSDELHNYPADSSTHPLNIASADIQVVPGTSLASGASTSSSAGSSSSTTAGGLSAWPSSMVSIDDLSPWVTFITLLAALMWGASHALTPGHGKTVVAAYLVGSRGTPRHAILLGLTVTATHTAGVFALGGITLYLSRFILPEHLYPWMDLLSGLLVVGIGVWLALRRYRDGRAAGRDVDRAGSGTSMSVEERHALAHIHGLPHHHGHDHGHDQDLVSGHTGKIGLRGLFALGVSGGLVPCPSALVLLLSAISLGRLGFGMILVLVFSMGLAIVLTSIGLLSLYARRLFQRFSFEPRIPGMLPVVSALAVTLGGLIVVAGALQQAGFI
jgi:nickel/cobalt exporter